MKSKYHNKHKKCGGILFQSDLEAHCWSVLQTQQEKGKIFDLRRQVRFTILSAIDYVDEETGEMGHQNAVHYVADFVYKDIRTGKDIVLDAKGCKTKVYELKKKMMRSLLGIQIHEIYKPSELQLKQ